MKPISDNGIVWVPASEVAIEFGRVPRTMRRWCDTGYVLNLGYRIKRDQTGHWLVGVPTEEYRTFKTYRARTSLQPSLL